MKGTVAPSSGEAQDSGHAWGRDSWVRVREPGFEGDLSHGWASYPKVADDLGLIFRGEGWIRSM
jgi:hypothetical protein